MSDEERKQISDKLKPLFLEASVKRPNNPKCYKVTGHAKERPDVWIADPFKSIVLEVRGFCAAFMLLQPKAPFFRDREQ